jgi:hypothetical protein
MSDIGDNKALALLTEIRVIVGKLEVHVVGNGGKGLLQRQDETEQRQDQVGEWIAKRPKVCPATGKEIMKSLVRAVSIATAVLGLIVGLSILGNKYMGDSRLEKLQEQMRGLQESFEKLIE